MNNYLSLAIILANLLLAAGCNNQSKLAQKESRLASASVQPDQQLEVLPIDINRSVVKWKGTKLMGTGYHEGTVKFSKGELVFSGKEITGGTLTVDMKSIYNTDIPLSDPVPRRNITTHLNSDFETTEFPVATFVIKSTKKISNSQLEIIGNMTIKGISNPMTVKATEAKPGEKYTSAFTFDRHNWKIGESGSWLEQKVVDADVMIELELILQN